MRDSANVLNSLAGHSQDPNYKFERLYRLLFNEICTHLPIKSCRRMRATIRRHRRADHRRNEHKAHSLYHWTVERRKLPSVPCTENLHSQKNGKQRPLGIPAFKDKLVQEVVRMILESIYEGHLKTARMDSDHTVAVIRLWLPYKGRYGSTLVHRGRHQGFL